MSESELRQAVEATEDEHNEKARDRNTDEVVAEVGEHHHGPAIDLSQGGEAHIHNKYPFIEAAHDAGYIVSNIKVFESFHGPKGPHTRIFLREASEQFDIGGPTEAELEHALESKDRARVEGFLVGVLVSHLAAEEDKADEDEGVMETMEAKRYLEDNNDFDGRVITSGVSYRDLYVGHGNTDPDMVDVPDGWWAFTEPGGVGFKRIDTHETLKDYLQEQYGSGICHLSDGHPTEPKGVFACTYAGTGTSEAVELPAGWRRVEDSDFQRSGYVVRDE